MCKKISRRDYKFPEWISKPARFVIHKLLDPNPETRISLEALFGNAWFKKSLKPETAEENALGFSYVKSSYNYEGSKSSGVTAFDIISMSWGLDLTRLFETKWDSGSKREKRFTSSARVEVVEEKVKEVGGLLGFKVEVGKSNGAIALLKGKVALVFELLEIVPHQLLLVAVKVLEGALEFEELHWGDWKHALQDLVLSWHNQES
ncbi:CBL-interacting serine/threonine-protein kinase 4 [Glycine soja]|nr:CBL-interacting serine/threonine-protein kinase 4 [Glycine soja]